MTGSLGHDLCKSEVQNLGMSTFGDENVCGLNVTMNYSLSMSSIQRISEP
jgi:hypothetical protein